MSVEINRHDPKAQQKELRGLYGGLRFEGESSFDVFLRYSNQKEILASRIVEIINQHFAKQTIHIFDIGVGEGTFHAKLVKFLMQNGNSRQVQFDLLDPNAIHSIELKGQKIGFEQIFPAQYLARIHHSTWEEYDDSQEQGKTDVVICSHTIYHLKPEEFKTDFKKMIGLLSPAGLLFIIARFPDEPYEFIKRFYEKATNKPFNEITIEDALPIIDEIVKEDNSIHYQLLHCDAKVQLPFRTDPEDAHTIVGFYLRRKWMKIPKNVRKDIVKFALGNNIIFNQNDGIVILQKS
jgi:hypothetical protein